MSHAHVVIDEAVFHAYQSLALSARYTPGLEAEVARLDEALRAFHETSAADPGHHREQG